MLEVASTGQTFDARLGFDRGRAVRVHRADTGLSQWAKLTQAHGGAEGRARDRFMQRLAQQIDERGTVDVLRRGVRDQNVEIRLFYRNRRSALRPRGSRDRVSMTGLGDSFHCAVFSTLRRLRTVVVMDDDVSVKDLIQKISDDL